MQSRKILSTLFAVFTFSGTFSLGLADKASAQSQILGEGGFLDPGSYVEHSFYGTSGQEVFVELNSNDFDTLVTVYDPTGRMVGQNDDYNGSLNSGLNLTLYGDGYYRVVVQGFDQSHRGRYRVSVYENTPTFQPIYESGFLDAGRYVEHYFEGTEGQTVTLTLQSSDFDTYLALYSPTSRKIGENDDDGGSLNSRLTMTLPATGVYRVLVQGYSSGDGGRYNLSIE